MDSKRIQYAIASSTKAFFDPHLEVSKVLIRVFLDGPTQQQITIFIGEFCTNRSFS